MGFNFNQLNTEINKLFQRIQVYFKSLIQYEQYAWIALGLGVVLVLIALITW